MTETRRDVFREVITEALFTLVSIFVGAVTMLVLGLNVVSLAVGVFITLATFTVLALRYQ